MGLFDEDVKKLAGLELPLYSVQVCTIYLRSVPHGIEPFISSAIRVGA